MPKELRLRDTPFDMRTAEGRTKVAELKTAAVRMRNFGISIPVIADKLDLTERDCEAILASALEDLRAESAGDIVARQQATINDARRALYGGLAAGDQGAINTMIKVMDHEAKLQGVYAPQRLKVGTDNETFATTLAQDISALGYVEAAPEIIDAETEDDGWANT